MQRARHLTAVLAVVAGLVVVSAAPASSLTELTWNASVGSISDGDTFRADIPSVGDDVKVRMTGVQAMEIGWCNASAASNRLAQLIDGEDVVLSAYDENATNRGRLLRWVSVNGQDVGLKLISEGLAFVVPHKSETKMNAPYLEAVQTARHFGTGPLWDPDRCGYGPDQDNPIRFWVQWDADGDDNKNLNGEYVRIWNRGSDDLELGGWQLRDSGLTLYSFPSGTKVPAGKWLTVHVGSGTDTALRRYWGNSVSVFSNVGDAAVLTDPDNDIRAIMDYPCKAYCDTSLQGKIKMWARYKVSTPEQQYIAIKNVSDQVINLAGFQVRNYPYNFDFTRKAGLKNHMYPGWVMKIYIGKGSSTWMKRYWGKSTRILDTRSDLVELSTFDGVRQACYAWGSRSC